jgi:hypothetical protein
VSRAVDVQQPRESRLALAAFGKRMCCDGNDVGGRIRDNPRDRCGFGEVEGDGTIELPLVCGRDDIATSERGAKVRADETARAHDEPSRGTSLWHLCTYTRAS